MPTDDVNLQISLEIRDGTLNAPLQEHRFRMERNTHRENCP
jgi:hypothetical protein